MKITVVAYSLFVTSVAIVTAGALVLASGCHGSVVGPQVVPHPPVVTDQSHCSEACDNLKRLGCPEGYPIDMKESCKVDRDCLGLNGKPDPIQTCSAAGGCMVSCLNFCTEVENAGVWVDPACVAQVQTCDEVSECPSKSPARKQ